MGSQRLGLVSLPLLWCGLLIGVQANGGEARQAEPLPFHLQAGFRSEITLRAAVLHSKPFAIVEQDPLTGDLSVHGLQIDLVQRLISFAAEDGVKLQFDLDPWEDSPENTYDAAIDLIANDCQEKLQKLPSNSNISKKYNCSSFDIVVADVFSTAARYLLVDMTPPWLSNAISAMKFVGTSENSDDNDYYADDNSSIRKHNAAITTLQEASDAQVFICVRKDTQSSHVVMKKFPEASFVRCFTDEECFQHLRYQRCVLYSRDELVLINKENEDSSYAVTRERFNTQYLVWPIRYDLDPSVSYLLKRWIKRAIDETTMDELYRHYFAKRECPIGTAGDNCELPCDPDHGLSDVKTGQCICDSSKWTGGECSIEVQEDLNLIPSTLKAISYCFYAINVAAVVFCAIWLIRNRESDQIRASQPFFLMMVLFGCVVSSSTIIALAQESPSVGPVPACMAIPWLYSLGFCFTFGTLFAKIRRVYLVFKSAGELNSSIKTAKSSLASSSCDLRRRGVSISFQETLLIIGAVTLIDVTILIAWTVADPLHWIRVTTEADRFGRPLESQGYCTCTHWAIFASLMGVYHLVLLTTGCFLCYKARKIPTMYQEGKFVAIALLCNIQILVVGVPIILLDSDPQSSFFVRSVMVWMNSFSVVAFIFGNLMFKALKAPSSRITDKEKFTRAVNEYSPTFGRGDRRAGIPPAAKATLLEHDDTEAPTLVPMTTQHQIPRNMVPSICVQSEQLEANGVPPEKKAPRNIVSSITVESSSEHFEPTKPRLTPGGLLPSAEWDQVSSLSMGSATSGRQKRSENRSVTFGMAYFPEGNEDGSELTASLELPLEANDAPDPIVARERTRSFNSTARFYTDSSQGAPRKPAKRGSCADDEDLAAHNDDEAQPSANIRATTIAQVETNAPPQRPVRMASLWEEDSDDLEGDFQDPKLSPVDYNRPHSPSTNTNMPPQRPVRLASTFESPTEDWDTTTIDSHSKPPIDNRPPQTPVVSSEKLDHASNDHQDPGESKAAASVASLGDLENPIWLLCKHVNSDVDVKMDGSDDHMNHDADSKQRGSSSQGLPGA